MAKRMGVFGRNTINKLFFFFSFLLNLIFIQHFGYKDVSRSFSGCQSYDYTRSYIISNITFKVKYIEGAVQLYS